MSSPPSKIQVRNVGNYVKLQCSGRGLPLPDVKWFKNGRPVLSTAMHNGTDLIKSKIVIDRFRPSDAGIYKCRFYNDENGTAEASTTISIALLFAWSFPWQRSRSQNCCRNIIGHDDVEQYLLATVMTFCFNS